jgi:hypothetical protein
MYYCFRFIADVSAVLLFTVFQLHFGLDKVLFVIYSTVCVENWIPNKRWTFGIHPICNLKTFCVLQSAVLWKTRQVSQKSACGVSVCIFHGFLFFLMHTE